MKPDKKALVAHVLAGGKPIDFPWMPPKRMERVLEGWARRGWWDSGVSLRTGWLTDLGREKLCPVLRLGAHKVRQWVERDQLGSFLVLSDVRDAEGGKWVITEVLPDGRQPTDEEVATIHKEHARLWNAEVVT